MKATTIGNEIALENYSLREKSINIRNAGKLRCIRL